MAAVARVCDEIVYPDLILFQIKRLKAISDHGKCHVQLLPHHIRLKPLQRAQCIDLQLCAICLSSSSNCFSISPEILTNVSQPETPLNGIIFFTSFRVASTQALNSIVVDVLNDIVVVREPARHCGNSNSLSLDGMVLGPACIFRALF